VPTVKRFEAGTGPRVSERARNKLRQAIEAAGIEFIEENGGGPGVRLKQRMKRTITSPDAPAAKPERSYDYKKPNIDTILLPVQCRMARVALGLGVRELAAAARVSPDTVARFERGDELKDRTVEALRQVLELAGVEFTNGDHPGVRLYETKAKHAEAISRASRKTIKTAAGPKRREKSPRK
jgi:transcriptional regulator with XRE-family HTH domain